MESELDRGAALYLKHRTWIWAGLALLGVAWLVLRCVAIAHVAVNWDELALLKGARHMAETGQLYGGGHPGLAAIVLLPFVENCQDEIVAIRAARILWMAFTLIFLAALGTLLMELQPDTRRRGGDSLLAMALLACVPAFLEWSIQVRADQIALAGGTVGGAFLLASRRRAAFAGVAGVLFGVGYLGSQKLVYVAALAALLALGQLVLWRELRIKREIARALLCLAGFGLVWAAYSQAVAVFFAVPEVHASQQVVSQTYVSRGLSVFDFYRNTIGLSQYRAMLPSLAPHGALFIGLVVASGFAARKRPSWRVPVLLSWAILALGAAVAWFHAAAFFYFWMTLGIFPAVAFAIARGPIRAVLEPAGAVGVRIGVVGFWLLLLAPAVGQTALMLRDTQAVQRESLSFVQRNFRSEAGFHPESGLFCHPGGQPISTHFSETIYRRFAGSDRAQNSDRMMQAFRAAPIAFVVESFRLNQFPVELRRFWAENYQPYRASVFVAGRRLHGARGSELPFELIVPGSYRWLPAGAPRPVRIDGRLVAPGEVLELDSGTYTADFVEDVPDGMLVLALREPPRTAPLAFYKSY